MMSKFPRNNTEDQVSIYKQGDVKVFSIRQIKPISDDFFLVEFSCMCMEATKITVMLSGDRTIYCKFYSNDQESGKPTVIKTPLKWKTFSLDDNILIMVKEIGRIPNFLHITVLITKKYP